MTLSPRAACALLIATFASSVAFAQQPTLSSERDRVGYMIGMDIAKSVAPAVPDMDQAAFQRALENALVRGKPLLDTAAWLAEHLGKELPGQTYKAGSFAPVAA